MGHFVTMLAKMLDEKHSFLNFADITYPIFYRKLILSQTSAQLAQAYVY